MGARAESGGLFPSIIWKMPGWHAVGFKTMPPGTMDKTIRACLAEHYGIEGRLSRLGGENLNYLVTTPGGKRFVAKIVDEHMPPDVVEMEFKAIEHAFSAGFPLQLPRILRNKHRKIETGIIQPINGFNRLRIMKFLEGGLLSAQSDISDNLLKNVGRSLAQFHRVMENFEHPAAHRNHRWNLAKAGQHRDKISLVSDPEKQRLLAWAFDSWLEVESTLTTLPQQFIHGDANHENILLNGERVSGLLDFGDSCINPTVCDLAICLAYLMMDRSEPLETAHLVTRAYEETRILNAREHAVLLPLVCGRLAVSVAVSQSRRKIDPDNPNWFGGEPSAWRLIAVLKKSMQ
jgi:Ser/Thr protein kinase RdoA (MazF antagonist)